MICDVGPSSDRQAISCVQRLETGGTPEFAAIKAAADRFNAPGADLQEGRFSPRYRRRGPVRGLHGGGQSQPGGLARRTVPGNSLNRLLRPIMSQCKNGMGLPLPGLPRPGPPLQGQPLPGLPKPKPEIPLLSHAAIPTCVAGLRQHYHTVWYDKPRPASSRR